MYTILVLEDDLLDGYDSGADDYVTKPFSMKIAGDSSLTERLREYE